MTSSRTRIREQVEANAGIHFNQLVRDTEFARGQIQYHVRRLVDDGALVRDEFYGQTHFYPPDYDEWERGALALFRRETAQEIVIYLFENEPATPARIAEDLDVARSTLEYHVDHLVEREIVEKRYGEHNRVTLTLVAPEASVRLLDVASPTLSETLVDRFSRLIDSFVEDAR